MHTHMQEKRNHRLNNLCCSSFHCGRSHYTKLCRASLPHFAPDVPKGCFITWQYLALHKKFFTATTPKHPPVHVSALAAPARKCTHIHTAQHCITVHIITKAAHHTTSAILSMYCSALKQSSPKENNLKKEIGHARKNQNAISCLQPTEETKTGQNWPLPPNPC